MHTDELMKRGARNPNFIGVFPLDKLPLHLPPQAGSFIVNSDTHNLPGQHWIAVSYNNGGIVKAFDPVGAFYPLALANYLARQFPWRRIIYNRQMHQQRWEKTCGEHCLRWLDHEYKHAKKY